MGKTELWQWDAVDLARAIRSREISSREATEACLKRLDDVNPKLNAITFQIAEQALRDADSADASVKAGEALGPLHGVPVSTKENIDQKDLPTPNGVVAYKDVIAPADAPVVANWRMAGAIFIGRTNAPAYSLRWDTDNALRGRTYNPWAKGRTPGGSSGGAGSAVASGIGPISHGNDYGGSIRYPAYCCGVAGIRPTMGRVPAFNPSAQSERPPTIALFAVQGPLARRVKDVRLGLHAMSGRDARDPWWVPAHHHGRAPQRPIKVGLITGAPGLYTHPKVAEAVRKAGGALGNAGYAVEEVTPPSIEAARELWVKLVAADIREMLWETIAANADPLGVKAVQLWRDALPPISMAEYIKGFSLVTKHRREWSLFLEQYPLIVGPNCGDLPFEIGFDTTDMARTQHVLASQALMVTVNLLGFPAAAVPVGTTEADGAPNGLPLGVQVIAGRYREDLALDAAEVIEAQHGLATPIDPVW
ncbi:MAG TPA: amidase [Dongiaceae bacterium]|jgi:amidase|nr:amidase [Dongiaceae bacterium]